MFTTKKTKIQKDGKDFIMRGYNLGNWMMLERFMFGFPGVDQMFRRYFLYYAGKEKYDLFFDRYYKIYFQKKDAEYLKKLGCNTLRIPFNYRMFESDRNPFHYDEKPFEYIDRVIEYCREQGIYNVIDYHAVQGYQSGYHVCDNITGMVHLFHDMQAQDRCVALWEFIVDHYKDNDNVIGFDLINEPYPEKDEIPDMIALYQRLIKAVRAIDKKHLIFVEGGEMAQNFTGFEAIEDDLLVHSPHYYVGTQEHFAAESRDEMRALVERDIEIRSEMSQKLQVPCWFGETGLSIGPYQEKKLEYVDLTLEHLNKLGYSWTLWTYKDLYRMGLLSTAEDSEWRNQTSEFITIKKKYNLDVSRWGEWSYTEQAFRDIDQDFPEKAGRIKQALWNNIINSFATFLVEDYAKLFAELPIDTLYRMIDSFDMDNCVVKQDWYDIFHARMTE